MDRGSCTKPDGVTEDVSAATSEVFVVYFLPANRSPVRVGAELTAGDRTTRMGSRSTTSAEPGVTATATVDDTVRGTATELPSGVPTVFDLLCSPIRMHGVVLAGVVTNPAEAVSGKELVVCPVPVSRSAELSTPIRTSITRVTLRGTAVFKPTDDPDEPGAIITLRVADVIEVSRPTAGKVTDSERRVVTPPDRLGTTGTGALPEPSP